MRGKKDRAEQGWLEMALPDTRNIPFGISKGISKSPKAYSLLARKRFYTLAMALTLLQPYVGVHALP